MIKQYLSSINITKYSCSARLYGKIHIGIGLLVVLFILACIAIEGMPEPIVLIIMSLIAIGILGYGAYFTWLRGKPLKREIVLGSWSNRLYLRSRWLFITAGIITCLAGFAVTIMIVSLISNGYEGMISVMIKNMNDWFSLLILLIYKVFHSYMSYYLYYRSPEYRASLNKDKDTIRA